MGRIKWAHGSGLGTGVPPTRSGVCRQQLHPFGTTPERLKPIWILMKQDMIGWQWHQLDHMQIICTSHQTDNHASTSPLNFL